MMLAFCAPPRFKIEAEWRNYCQLGQEAVRHSGQPRIHVRGNGLGRHGDCRKPIAVSCGVTRSAAPVRAGDTIVARPKSADIPSVRPNIRRWAIRSRGCWDGQPFSW